MTDTPPPRPGYNRDGWENGKPITTRPVDDPLVLNVPMLLATAAGIILGGGVLVPLMIMLWRAAL